MSERTNWSGAVRFRAERCAKPSSERELVVALRDNPAPVRVVGAGHSFSPLIETSGCLISLEALQGVLSVDAEQLTARLWSGTKIHALGRPLLDAGVALINQGDIDRQTVGGALGTGTHGTGPTLGSLSAELAAFRLVTSQGEVLDCSRTSNPDIWAAGCVSFGSLGVMSEVTLNVRPAYKLRERQWLMPQEQCWREFARHRDATRHFELFCFPYADLVLAKSLAETDEPCAPPLTSTELFARGEAVGIEQHAFACAAELARLAPAMSGPVQRFFTRVATLGQAERVGFSHEVFPSSRAVKFNELEYAVPAADGPDCVRELASEIRRRRVAGVYPLEVRFIRGDDCWLSPFYQRDSVSISVHQYHKQPYDELFALAESVFGRYGGRPHWGKLHSLKAADLARLYPRFDDYRALRKRLDPDGRLLNAHLRGIFGE
jgi:FAD-linked oxidoreductase